MVNDIPEIELSLAHLLPRTKLDRTRHPETMRVTRTILALILAAAVSILPVGAGIASVGKSGGLAGTQSVSGCHEHGQHDGNKPADADKAACIIACASMCWANTIAPPSDQLLGRLQGTIDPVVSEGASLPHIASPPFRPPRI